MTENNYGGYPNQQQPPSYSSTQPQGAYASYAQVYGQGLPQEMDKPVQPTSIKIAAYGMYAIVALNLLSTILGFVFRAELMESSAAGLNSTFGSILTDSDMSAIEAGIAAESQTATADMVLSIIFTLIMSAALVAFTMCMTKGQNWARIVLTVYTGFSVLGLFSMLAYVLFFHWTMLLTPIGSLLAIVVLVFLWLSSSNTYMREMRVYRAWQKQRAYMGS